MRPKCSAANPAAGFYKYEGKEQKPNEALQEWRGGVVAGVADPGPGQGDATGQPGSTTPATTESDLARRLVFLMVNEAARCLEEKVVAAPEDADYGMILGTGFPTFRGGPLRYAENYGLKKLVTEMDGLQARVWREICAVRFASSARSEWDYIL